MPKKKITPLNEEFDFKLFISITKKTLPWLLFFVFLSIASAYIYLRYTPPVYEASTVIKVTSENNANKILDINNSFFVDQTNTKLAGDIELIRSNIITGGAISKLPLEISYYSKGNILDFERYVSTPFTIKPLITDSSIFGRNINIKFKTDNKYTLHYTDNSGNLIEKDGKTEEILKTPFGEIIVNIMIPEQLKQISEDYKFGEYYFRFNHPQVVLKKY